MHASLLRRWLKRTLIAGSVIVLLPGITVAGWPWSKPAPQPVIPVGPPIYTPTTPTVVNYQPATAVPSNAVPAASLAPTLGAPPATTFAPSTTVAPAPAVPYAPAPATVVAPAQTFVAPAGCGRCATTPQVTNYVPPTYRTNWQAVPTTTYRPVAAVDPVTGLPINAVAPCTTNVWQARRVPNTLWGGLWPATSAPPTVVAYTPATIAAYPAARVTNYAPPPTILATSPVVTQYAPAPVVTQYAPAPTVTNFAPTTIAPAPTTTFAPSVPSTIVPSTTVPSTTLPGTFPSAATDPSACPPGTVMPSNGQTYAPPANNWPSQPLPSNGAPLNGSPATQSPTNGQNGTNGRQPADIQPRLDSRNYAPQQYDDEPLVPVNPPATERRVLETPRIEGPSLRSPANNNNNEPNSNSSSWNQRSPSPFVPFARPAEKPASTPLPERNLRLVPDPDAERLDLRRNEIPNLIKPGDRTTARPAPSNFASVPIQWPERPTTVQKPVMELERPQTRPVTASIPAATEKLDDSGWQQVGR